MHKNQAHNNIYYTSTKQPNLQEHYNTKCGRGKLVNSMSYVIVWQGSNLETVVPTYLLFSVYTLDKNTERELLC